MAFGGYTKLSSSILASTVWREPNETRIVWITMLALANAQGVVEASVPGLADFARVSLEACEQALLALQATDPYSRTKDHDGRRIEPVDGGWLLLNYERYRERVNTEDRREYLRLAKQRSRQRAVNGGQQLSTKSTQAEAEAEAEAENKRQGRAGAPPAAATADDLRAAWDKYTTEPIRRIHEMNDARRRAATSRLRERGLEGMCEVFRRINASAFCRGENDRGWCADFDFALKPAKITMVLEGKYDPPTTKNRQSAPTPARASRGDMPAKPEAVAEALETRRRIDDLIATRGCSEDEARAELNREYEQRRASAVAS